jgi:hypothetical protein
LSFFRVELDQNKIELLRINPFICISMGFLKLVFFIYCIFSDTLRPRINGTPHFLRNKNLKMFKNVNSMKFVMVNICLVHFLLRMV